MTEKSPAEEIPSLVWATVFKIGNAKLDAEHRELVVDVNNLTRMLAEGRKWSQIVARSKRLRDKRFAPLS